MMFSLKLLLVAVFAVFVVPAQSLFLGNGGVYDSPEAQEYWNRRFGSGILSAARAAGAAARGANTAKVQALVSNEVDVDAAPVTTPVKTVVRQPKRVFVPRRRVVYYVPTFQGTYAKPSPIYTRYVKVQSP